MKVLHVISAFEPARAYGGPVESVSRLCRWLAQLGAEIRVLTTNADGAHRVVSEVVGTERELVPGLRVRYCRRTLPDAVSGEFLRALGPCVRWAEVVHITGVYSFPVLPALIFSRALCRPVVLSPRGSFGAWGQEHRRLLKSAYNAVVRFLTMRGVVFHATSEQDRENIFHVLGSRPCVVIPNGIELSEFESTANGDSLLSNSSAWARPRIGFLGRIHPIKGLDRLLHAVPALLSGWPELEVVLAGPDTDGEGGRLRELARRLGIEHRVQFIGEVTGREKQVFFAGLDVFVLPSHYESFGLVVAEALATRTPVVVSEISSWRCVEDWGCGRWVPNTPEALAEAIADVLVRGARAVGNGGRERIATELGWEQLAGRMIEFYQQCLAGPVARAGTVM